jgi:hypothetical protein
MTAFRELSRRGCKDSMRSEGVEVRVKATKGLKGPETKGRQRPPGQLAFFSCFLMFCRFRKFLVKKKKRK